MSFASKYNHGQGPRWAVKLNHPSYTNLADLLAENGSDYVYPICAIYENDKGKYGPQPCVAISDTVLVNLPQHLLEDCRNMRQDSEAVEAINNGQAGFRIYTYNSKSGRACYSVSWVDLK